MQPNRPHDRVQQPAPEAVTDAAAAPGPPAGHVDPSGPLPEELMTRREVAYRFGVTTATVKNWARSNAVVLTEVRDGQGKPRYRRAEVDALFASGFRGFESRSAASRLRRM
jgi:hypothetical protein